MRNDDFVSTRRQRRHQPTEQCGGGYGARELAEDEARDIAGTDARKRISKCASKRDRRIREGGRRREPVGLRDISSDRKRHH